VWVRLWCLLGWFKESNKCVESERGVGVDVVGGCCKGGGVRWEVQQVRLRDDSAALKSFAWGASLCEG